jgi:hypothetical protein
MQQEPDQFQNSSNPTGGRATVDRGNVISSELEALTQTRASQKTELAQLLLLTCIGSLIIVGYVWSVNKYSVHRTQTDILENAALLAARELSEITVQHSSLGDIGLCDLPPGRVSSHGISQTRATSIYHLYDTLNVDKEIAVKLNHALIEKLADNDLGLAQKLEYELAQKLKQAVEPDLSQNIKTMRGNNFTEDQDNNVYRDVFRMIAADREAQKAASVQVKVKLGWAKSAIFNRDCDPHQVDTANFQDKPQEHAPYLVQVEAIYDKRGKSKNEGIVKRSRCALIAAPNVEPPPAAFVINFPAGVPPIFKSVYDILAFKNWTSNGDWQQAVGSNVPGNGSLAPPLGSVGPSMSPGDAATVALYDWLKSAGPAVDSDRAVGLIKSIWDVSPLTVPVRRPEDVVETADLQAANVNSCLARDTGAREYSIMNQTAPGSTGQTALARAFSIFGQSNQAMSQQPTYPQSALPLYVGKNGKCNIAGRHDFDQALIRDFLSCVQRTNIAAISSLSTAKQLLSTTNVALSQLEQKMFIEKQELASVTSRLARSQDEPAKGKDQDIHAQLKASQHIVDLSNERIATLNAIIDADERQRLKFQRMHRLAIQATVNATKVSNSTFDLGAHAFKFCRSGLFRIDAPRKGFLVGIKYVFFPCTEPLTEADFTSLESLKALDTPLKKELEPQSPWFAKTLDSVFTVQTAFPGPLYDQVKVEGRTLTQLMQNPPVCSSPSRGMIVLDSSTINAAAEGKPTTRAFRQYAFSNIPIPPGQLLYYCQNAAQTGDAPRVSWSMLLRDLVASKASNTGDEPVGNPIASQERNWCSNKDTQKCPGLACEIQIRCPLPVLNKMVEDAYLKNPMTNAQVPQIPPVPPDML